MYHTIYKTTNLLNGKIYIGKHSTSDLNDSYLGSGLHLTRAINTHGKENFRKEILFVFNTEEEAFKKELELVNETFVSRDDTYNLMLGGHGAPSGENHPMFGRNGELNPMFGRRHTEETREKISNARENLSDEYRQHMSDSQKGELGFWYGKKRPDHSEALKGRFAGDKNPRYGKPGTFLGKQHTEETREKMSKANKGRKASQETKEKLANMRTGIRWWSCDELKISKYSKEDNLDKNYVWYKSTKYR
jgi:hypothetical protein